MLNQYEKNLQTKSFFIPNYSRLNQLLDKIVYELLVHNLVYLKRVETINLVWFKKDLRTYDNEALYEALKTENVIPIFVVEPDLWKLPDHSSRQWEFVRECLIDLNNSLNEIGLKLIIKVGNI